MWGMKENNGKKENNTITFLSYWYFLDICEFFSYVNNKGLILKAAQKFFLYSVLE